MARELKKIQAENAALAKKVQAGRESIAQTDVRISTAVEDWKVRKYSSITWEMYSCAGKPDEGFVYLCLF